MKGLVGFFIIIAVIGLVLLTMILRFVFQVFHSIRSAKKAFEKQQKDSSEFDASEYEGETYNQRTKRQWERVAPEEQEEQTAQQNTQRTTSGNYQKTTTSDGATIVDMRRPEQKIFDDDEGEYAQFEEVDN